MDQSDDWVAVGTIVGAFGVHGEVKVEPLTDVPDRFEQLATVYVGDERQPHRLDGARVHKRLIVARLDGVTDMTTAERLRGASLWIPAAEIAPLPADQYYIHDLLGLRVEHVNGTALGRVADVLSGGGNDLLVVRNDESGAETLVPTAKEFVKSVDLAARVLYLDPIPGLFDDDAVIDNDEPEANATAAE